MIGEPSQSDIFFLAMALVVFIILLALTAYLFFYLRRSMETVDRESSSLADIRARHTVLEAENKQLEGCIEERKKTLLSLEGAVAEKTTVERELTALQESCLKKEEQLRRLEERTADLQKLLNDEPRLAESVEKLRTTLTSLMQEKDARKLELNELERKAETVKELLADAEKASLRHDELVRRCAMLEKDSERLELVSQELLKAQQSLDNVKAEVQSTLREKSNLEREHNDLKSRLEDMQRLAAEFDRDEARHQETLKELVAAEEKLRDARTERDSVIEERNNVRLELENERIALDDVRGKIQSLTRDKDARDTELAELSGRVKSLQNSLQSKEEELKQRTAEVDKLEDKYRQNIDNLSEVTEKLDNARMEAKIELMSLEETRSELQRLDKEKSAKDTELAELTARITALNAKREALSGSALDQDQMNAAYEDLYNDDFCSIQEDALLEPAGTKDERTMLSSFQRKLQSDGLQFPDRVLAAFHTSLKCQSINPLTVLAGVSGTGKTLLPVKYAEFFGIHPLVIPVQPRWDSPQDLFGFYNYLECRFKATELSRALVHMDPYNFEDKDWEWAHERMLLVLLDEMNLARTEYYFSEFLSKLELRRQVEYPDEKMHRAKAEIELDAGTAGQKISLWVPYNVLFVGTMNEDESTQTLSDKVLDRANVLRFGKPRDLDQQGAQTGGKIHSQTATDEFLPWSTWNEWLRDESQMSGPDHDQCGDWINRLNAAMEKIGRPFGYRVRDAIMTYIANYPDLNRTESAMADQIEQKILPKLRGVDTSQANPNIGECLDSVATIIDETGDSQLRDAFHEACDESRHLGLFVWRGVSRD